jgi:hypothetical protein
VLAKFFGWDIKGFNQARVLGGAACNNNGAAFSIICDPFEKSGSKIFTCSNMVQAGKFIFSVMKPEFSPMDSDVLTEPLFDAFLIS